MPSISSLFEFRGRRSLRAYPGLQANNVLYVVGDIHGRLDCLIDAHNRIDLDRRAAGLLGRSREIYIGDYVDRGNDSRGVIDCLLSHAKQVETIFLRGNHEMLFEHFLEGQLPFRDWRQVGGAETLLSYGVSAAGLVQKRDTAREVVHHVPPDHRAFLRSLKNYYVVGGYCFVHAGLRPQVALEKQVVSDLIWIRNDFLSYTGSFGHVVVHGHSPVPAVDFRPNRINIDTGAYITNRLSVLKIDESGPTLL